jgi:hypothetical protein
LLLTTAFSRYPEALDWARDRLTGAWGGVAAESPMFDFDSTDYYQSTMGGGLRKIFFAFERLRDPAELVESKLQTNRWEDQYAAGAHHPEPRPLNLDPGYLTMSKLVLASTKDFAHRIYIDRGIYAEITLCYRQHGWQHHQFTFADYRREDYQEFFSRCRQYLHGRLREARAK